MGGEYLYKSRSEVTDPVKSTTCSCELFPMVGVNHRKKRFQAFPLCCNIRTLAVIFEL